MDEQVERDGIRGVLHLPDSDLPVKGALALTHGAGGDSASDYLKAVASAFVALGLAVLRYDLPFRVQRPAGPPHPSRAAADREGIAAAAEVLRARFSRPLLLGGHSYGGRQCTLLAAEQPDMVDGLVLLSYPLHPPGKPERLRTEHLPRLTVPAVFVHGTKDPFGSIEELRAARALIPARTVLTPIDGVGHDMGNRRAEVCRAVIEGARELWPV